MGAGGAEGGQIGNGMGCVCGGRVKANGVWRVGRAGGGTKTSIEELAIRKIPPIPVPVGRHFSFVAK